MEHLSPASGHHPVAPAYERHRPEETVLYGVVQSELESFLARVRDRPLPRFVEREFRGFLECGILAHGFLRVHCGACGRDRIVAFSCKGRGFCPSCLGRRMADTAAHLVDRVLPEAPVRQWVLTVPFALRYRLAYDAALTSLVLREFVREVLASYRRRARECGPSRRRRGGAVTFIQRFGDALNLNVHFHTLMLDGVYERYGEPGMGFRGLTPPDDDEVRRVVERVARRVARLMVRRGLSADADPSDADPLAVAQPQLAGLAADSVRGLAAGGRPARRGDRIDPEDLSAPAAPRCAAAMGFTLHADVAVPARDRPRLERLCRYVARPPVATERLERLPDGRLLYHLRHRWRDGTTRIVFEPHQLLARLVPLIPAPRAHQVRYHGVLAPCAGWRDRVVPGGPAAEAGDTARPPDREAAEPSTAAVTGRPLRRYPWADLLRRVFAVDVLECPDCGGPMRILAAIHPPEATRAILECLGLPSRPPPTAPARPDPESPELAPSDQ
jgi:hypothetical protein